MKLADLMKRLGLMAKEERQEVELKETEELQEMLAAFEANEKSLAEAVAQVADMQSQLEQFAEQKAQAEVAAAQAIADALKVKMDARFASLSKEVGDERAQAVLAATENLDDVQFEAIATALKVSAKQEAETPLFKEAGASAPSKADAQKEETLEMKNLKKKYAK